MSLHHKRYQGLRPQAVLKKRRRILQWRAGLIAFNILVWLTVAILIGRFDRLQVSNINFTGNQAVSSYRLLQIVNEELSHNYLWLIPKKNILLFPSTRIEKRLLLDFPRLQMVVVDRKFPDAILIEISEREQYATWCEETAEPSEEVGEVRVADCFFIDRNGLAFSEAIDFSGTAYVRFYDGSEGDLIRKNFSSPYNFSELVFFLEAISKESLEIKSVRSISESKLEIELLNNGRLILGGKNSLGQVFNNLSAVMNDKSLNFGSTSEALDYIDLRFGGKVFYKEK